MMNRSVIFDTNAYRVFAYDQPDPVAAMEALLDREKATGNTAFISPIVLLELGAHLADPADSAYKNCMDAFRIAYLHARANAQGQFNMIPDPESHLTKLLFDKVDESLLNKLMGVGQIAAKLYNDPSESVANEHRADFASMLAWKLNVKEQFINDMYRYVVKDLDPTATDWNPLKNNPTLKRKIRKELKTEKPIDYFAMAQVVKAARLVGEEITSEELIKKAAFVKQVFPAPLYLYRFIFNKIIETGADLTNPKKKRWNWLLDIQLLFSISTATMGGRSTLLVTGDQNVRDAAIESGLSDHICSLKEYLSSL